MKTLLVTGFDRFLGYSYNSTEEVLPLFHGVTFVDFSIKVLILPTSYENSWPKLRQAIETMNPHALISFGMRAGSDYYAIEMRGINKRVDYDESSKKINSATPRYIQPEGALFRYTAQENPLHIQSPCLDELPLTVSFNAGSFICNYLLYQTLGFIDKSIQYSFIHIPAFAGDAKSPAKGKTFYQLYRDIQLLLNEITSLWAKTKQEGE